MLAKMKAMMNKGTMENQNEWLPPAQEVNVSELDALVTESADAWAEYEELHKVSAAAYKDAEAIDLKIIALLKQAGKSKWFVDGIGTMQIKHTSQVRVPGTIEEKEKLFNYLSERGKDVFLALATVNSQTLNSWYRQEAETARENGTLLGFSVPGVQEPTTRESLSFTKDKKAKS